MTVHKDDIIKANLKDVDMQMCVNNAKILCETITDRPDLHLRSYMERYINILMGEAAEVAVIEWLRMNGKYAVSAVNKTSGKPDLGHDIIVKNKKGEKRRCSVKSSLSVHKKNLEDILDTFTVATKESEIREVNVQVYYWLDLHNEKHRITVPSNENMAIIGWVGRHDIERFTTYNGENRQVADIKLRNIRSMQSLLDYLQ